MQIFAKNLALS